MSYRFLTKNEILAIHREMVTSHGGSLRIWDESKLDAAIAAPKSGFGNIRIHDTIWEVGAAYWFHISQAHAFESANKRTAVEACLTFLFLNGYTISSDHETLFQIALDVATSKIEENDLANWLKENISCI